MDQCNLDSCSLQHAGQNADEDSPAKRTRAKQRAMNAEHKHIQGKRVTKGGVQYLHMQECLVYAAVEVSQQDFEGGSMFRYGNKTQAFTKISRHLGTGQHRDLFKHEDGEISINQIKHMLDDATCKSEDSGKKSATNGGRCQSGRNDGDLTSCEQACDMLCAWQTEVSHDSKLRKDANSNAEAASVVASSLKQKHRPTPALSATIHMSAAEAQSTLEVRAHQGRSKRREAQLLAGLFPNIPAARKSVLKNMFAKHMVKIKESLLKEFDNMDDGEQAVAEELEGAPKHQRLMHSEHQMEDIEDEEVNYLKSVDTMCTSN